MTAGVLADDSKAPDRTLEVSPRRKARVAAVFYLITIVTAIFSEIVVRGNVVVSNDAAATARNILASELLYRLGFVADLIASASYVVVTAILYDLLKPVSRNVSLLAAFFSLVGIAIGALNALGHLAPLVFLRAAQHVSAFDAGQLQAMALLSLKLHAQGANISLVFFGLYCVLLGYLIFQSGFLPRTVGVLMAIAGCALLVNSFATFLSPPIANALSMYMLGLDGLGELSLTLWLLVMGVNVIKWQERAYRA